MFNASAMYPDSIYLSDDHFRTKGCFTTRRWSFGVYSRAGTCVDNLSAELSETFTQAVKIGLAGSKSPATQAPTASALSNSPSKQPPSSGNRRWSKRLFSFGKQRQAFVNKVAPAPQGVSTSVPVGWGGKRGANFKKGEKRVTMSVASPPEGVEEMETDMSPEPNGKMAD